MSNKILSGILIFICFISDIYSNPKDGEMYALPDAIVSDSLQVSPVEKKESFFERLFNGNVDRSYERAVDLSFVVAPSYTREASFGVGGLASGLYRLDRSDSIIPPSNISLTGNASVLGFYALAVNGNNYFKGNRSRLSYIVNFTTKPLDFWGITYDDCEENPVIDYTRRQIELDANYVYRLTNAFYIGGALDFMYSKISKIDDISYLLGQKRSYTFTGLGASIQYDTRDFIPNPTQGVYVMVREIIFPKLLGSYDKTLFRTTVTADFYQQLWMGGILATDIYGQFNSNKAPWALREELGSGGSRMRGYYGGRYIDTNFVSGQIEMRQHIIDRLGFTSWIGGGTVFPEFKDFDTSKLLPTYGVGLRLEFKKNINARIDYGFGKQTGGFVFNIGEAF